MDKKYLNEIKTKIILLQNKEDNEKIHEFNSLEFSRDIVSNEIKTNIEGIRHMNNILGG